MIEWGEKLMAALSVLVILFIVLIVAFRSPSDMLDTSSSPRPENTDQDLNGLTALPKGNANPQQLVKLRKTVERLPDSSDNQKALYRYAYVDKLPYRDVRAERRDGYVVTRRVVYQRPEYPQYYKQRYITRREVYEPRYFSPPVEDCSFGSCLCNCDKPYWAGADWYESADCWYE